MEVNEKELKEVLDDLDQEFMISDLVSDNKLHFSWNNNVYRVRMPNQRETALAEEEKNSLYVKLINQDNTITKKRLIKILKEKQGVDILAMYRELNDLEKEMFEAYLVLGPRKTSEEKTIEKYKNKIYEIKLKRQEILTDIGQHLSPAIESQTEAVYLRYLTSCCTEKYYEKDKRGEWLPVWTSFENYLKDDSQLTLKALGTTTRLLLETRG